MNRQFTDLTHLIFGFWFSQSVNKLPSNIKEINIYANKTHLLKKIHLDVN